MACSGAVSPRKVAGVADVTAALSPLMGVRWCGVSTKDRGVADVTAALSPLRGVRWCGVPTKDRGVAADVAAALSPRRLCCLGVGKGKPHQGLDAFGGVGSVE